LPHAKGRSGPLIANIAPARLERFIQPLWSFPTMSADPEDLYEEFKTAARAGNLDTMRKMVAEGFNINDDLDTDTTLLEEVIGELGMTEEVPRHDVVREMLSLGADAKRLSDEGSSPLFAALLSMDTEMVRILLDAGADPNAMEMESEFESLYDWAEADYQFEVWGEDKPPQTPTTEEQLDSGLWLEFLERLAVAHDRLRPDHLRLMHERGARRMTELKLAKLPMEPTEH
jgi:hypothetical protein